MVQRIEELEDLVHDLKNSHNAQESVELKAIIENQSHQLNGQQIEISELSQKKCKSADLFGQNDLYQTFQKLIMERDEIIKTLVFNLQQHQQQQALGDVGRNSHNSAFTLGTVPNNLTQNLEDDAQKMNSALTRLRENQSTNMVVSDEIKPDSSLAKPIPASATNLYGMSERDNWLLSKDPAQRM